MTSQINFADYERLIDKLCWQSWRRLKANGVVVDIDDLKQEGAGAFVRAVEKFDASRGAKFSTYLYRATQNALAGVATGEYGENHTSLDAPIGEDGANLVDLIEDAETLSPLASLERQLAYNENMASVSEDTRHVLLLLMSPPKELMQEIDRCRAHSARAKKLGHAAPSYKLTVQFIMDVLEYTKGQRARVGKDIKWIMQNNV